MTILATEAQEQAALFKWARMQAVRHPALELMYAVPNGGKRDRIEAARLKAQGVLAGVTDVVLPCARGGYFGLYLEMKREDGGVISAKQRWFEGRVIEEGYAYAMCAGWDMARVVILRYLSQPRTKVC